MCSRIQWNAEEQPVIVGRSMDWADWKTKLGTKLRTMPAGVERNGLVDENPLKWTSQYGSVISEVWDCATSDGLNEAGLAANLLYLAEATYGDRDTVRPGISIAIWVQYFLDTCATVSEAVEAAKACQVQPFELVHAGKKANAPLHLSFSDLSGDSAILEVVDGELRIHHGPQYTTMTNSPVFEEQLVLLKQYQGLGGTKPIPGTMEAADRFARGAYYLLKLPAKPTSYPAAVAGVLSVIRNMSTPFLESDPAQPNNATTVWRTICDCTNKRYYFEFCDMPNLIWIDLKDLDLGVGAPEKLFDLDGDVEAAGNVSDKFKPADPLVFQKANTPITWKPAA